MAGFFGLFNYDKEGPGVAKNGPEKRRFIVFFEILGRKIWNLSLAGLMWSIVNLPILTRGLADAGLTLISRNFSREKHAFVREDFFESIRKNWKIALPIGIINTLVTGVLFYNIFFYIFSLAPELALVFDPSATVGEALQPGWLDFIIIAVTVMVYVTFTWMKYYIPFLMITFKLNLKQIYKNAFLFAGANLPANLLISVALIAVYLLMGGLVLMFASTRFSVLVFAIVLLLMLSVVPGFRSLLIQFCIFPSIKKLIIDPYYAKNPNADKQARRDLNLDVEEDPIPEEEIVFAETVPDPVPAEEEKETPTRSLPRQYNEKEMRRFNRQVQSHNTPDDDDDTI